MTEYKSFEAFYPFYLSQHANQTNRRLHIIGTTLALCLLIRTILYFTWGNLLTTFVVGYGFAWVGHFFFEKNRPATFKHPFYSLLGDFKMVQ